MIRIFFWTSKSVFLHKFLKNIYHFSKRKKGGFWAKIL
jgi:hypothetical protein